MSREGTLSNFSGTRVCMIETNKRLNSLSSQSGTFGEQRILNTYSNRSNIEHAHRNGCRCSCVSSFLLLLLCPLFSRLFLAAAGPGLILTLEQQSQVRRLSVVYFVSVCLLWPECKHARTHTHKQLHSQPCSLALCLKWMDDILLFTIHICFSLSSMMLNLSAALFCLIWGSTNAFLYSILYCFFIQGHACLYLSMYASASIYVEGKILSNTFMCYVFFICECVYSPMFLFL